MQTLKQALCEIEYFLLDMDGTVYLGDKLIGDMPKTLDALRSRGKKIIYLTNNSSKSKERYYEKLSRMDLLRDGDEVYSSGMATAEYLSANYPENSVYLLGTRALGKEFKERGIRLVDGRADISVLAYDTELTYEKLCKFTSNVMKGSRYIATHPDVNCPAEDVFVPDAGALIELVYASTGVRPELIIGKPYPFMGENLMKRFSLPPEKFVMVGDRLNTDIKFGRNCNFHTLLVLSGESALTDVERLSPSDKPEFILDSLNDVVDYL